MSRDVQLLFADLSLNMISGWSILVQFDLERDVSVQLTMDLKAQIPQLGIELVYFGIDGFEDIRMQDRLV